MINLDDIRAAAARIEPVAHRTPILTSRTLDGQAGVSAYFKCENFQRGGAFKIRGATNFIFSIPKEELGKGVVAFSSGNHAQAVSIAAREVGIKATIVMPIDAPRSKVEATRGYGAEVVLFDRMREDREEIGRRISEETGATLVPPYNHEWIMTGQGTVALETLEEVSGLDALIAPVGGGGLLSGCSIAAKGLNPGIRVFGAEPELANDTYLSLKAGKPVGITETNTIADGLRAAQPGALTFPVIQQLVEEVILVTEAEIRAAMRFLLTRMKLLVEPSGATSVAAVMFGKLPRDVRSVGVVISGGNVDLDSI